MNRRVAAPAGEAVEPSDIHSLAQFEQLAEAQLEQGAFDYIAGGAGDELTTADNVAAWRRRRLRPRVMVDVSQVELATTLLGSAVAMPVGVAPVAFQHFAHHEAELAMARAASKSGVLFCLSTMSSRSIEDVAAAADEAGGGPRWFQLYVHRERSRSEDLVRRAEAADYGAIVVTADFPVAGRRERDLRNRLGYPQAFGNFSLSLPADRHEAPAPTIGSFTDAALSWSDLDWLRGLTPLPIVLKGVLTGADTALAADHGVSAVVVSNHGGRQLDRAIASADALAEVVEAAAGRVEVYVDGGIRRGGDVLIALALGARGAFIGRPMVYALAVGGEAGVARAIDIVHSELATDMALLGTVSPAALGAAYLAGEREPLC